MWGQGEGGGNSLFLLPAAVSIEVFFNEGGKQFTEGRSFRGRRTTAVPSIAESSIFGMTD